MLAAIQEMASRKEEVEKDYHLATLEFLQACNSLFEEGILSHKVIKSSTSPVLQNMTAGFNFFEAWHKDVSCNNPGWFTL